MACATGQVDCVELLIGAEASVDMRDGRGVFPLQMAFDKGHLDCAQLLIAARADVDQPRHFTRGDPLTSGTDSLLHWAVAHDDPAVVQLLVDSGAGLEAEDSDEDTALELACQYGGDQCVRILLDAGAASGLHRGTTPLITAAVCGWPACIRELLRHNAAIDEASLAHGGTALPGCRRSHRAHGDPVANRTARDAAVANGHALIANWLEATHEWHTPLHYLDVKGLTSVREMLRTGADVHACRSASSPSPLDVARYTPGVSITWPT
eukprot:344875-Prymnesium_polylepis.1